MAGGASLLLLVSCGGSSEYVTGGTDRAIGADATIEVEELEGGNFLVHVAVEHLPPPGRVGPGLTTYVVWFAVEGQPAQRAGNLDYDPDERRGAMQATSPNPGFEVIVSAERRPNPGSPGDKVVVRQAVSPD
jgi:hypothetical protein